MAAGAGETGFFNFGTNADQVAADIAGAMGRINSTLSQPLRAADLALDIGGLGKTFTGLEAELKSGQARVQQAISQFGRGAIDAKTLHSEVRGALQTSVGNIPQIMADTLAKAPTATFNRAPIREIAGTAANDYVNAFKQQLAQAGISIPAALQQTINKSLAGVEANPVNFGGETTPLANLTNRLRAENLLAQQIRDGNFTNAAPILAGLKAPDPRFTSIQPHQITTGESGIGFNPTPGLAQDVRERIAAAREAEAIGRRRIATDQEEARAAQELALANLAVAESYSRIGSRYVSPTGQVYRQTGQGLAEETNPLRNAEAQQRLAAQEQRNQQRGFLGGALGRIDSMSGGAGIGAGFGKSIISATAFSAAYGSIYALQGAVRDTLKEFLDYQDSMTDLEVATRSADNVTNELTDSLANIARVAGDNVGAAYDAAARGVRAFTTAQSSQQEVTDAAANSARTAAQLSVIANKSLTDATGDLLAAGTAFNLNPDELDQVVDAVANAKRNVGGDAGQISQGLALISLAAQEAGYNLNEAASVLGLVQARTDQSGQAIATRLTRIFQITQGSTGKSLAQSLSEQLKAVGLDDPKSASVKEQLEAYAKIYSDDNTPEAVKDKISSSLGGTANLRELLPLLKEADTLQAAYDEALRNGGQGVDEYQRKSQNLVGTLKKLGADVSGIQVELAKSGVFDIVGGFFMTIEPALFAMRSALTALNDLTGKVPGLQSVLGVMLDILIAAKAISIVQGARAATTAGAAAATGATAATAASAAATTGLVASQAAAIEAAALQARLSVTQAAANDVLATTQAREAAAAEAASIANNLNALAMERQAAAATLSAEATTVSAGATAAGGRFAGTRAGLGAIGGALANPYVLGAIALLGTGAAVGSIINNRNQISTEQSAVNSAVRGSYKDVDGTSSSLATAAGELKSAADRISKIDVRDQNQDAFSENLEIRSNNVRLIADRVLEEEKANSRANDGSFLFGENGAIETVDQLAQGLSVLQASGAGAVQQMRELDTALRTPFDDSAQRFSPEQLTSQIYASVAGAVNKDNVPDDTRIKYKRDEQIFDGWVTAPSLDKLGNFVFNGFDNKKEDQTAFSSDPDVVANMLQFEGTTKKGETPALAKAIREQIDKLGLTNANGLTDADKERLVNAAVDSLNLGQITEGADALREAIRDAALADIRKQRVQRDSPGGLLNNRSLTPDQAVSLLTPSTGNETTPGFDLLGTYDAAIQAQQAQGNENGVLAATKAKLAQLKSLADKVRLNGSNVPGILLQQIATVEKNLIDGRLDRLERMRAAAESHAGSNSELQAIRISFAKREIRAAGNDPAQIESLLNSYDQKTIQAILSYLRTAIATARAAYQHALKIQRASQALLAQGFIGPLPNLPGSGIVEDAQTAVDDTKKKFNLVNDINDKFAQLGDATAKLPDDSKAEEALEKARKALEARIARLSLVGDITDPVEQARDALKAAQMTYAFEKTPQNAVAIRTAQAALEQAKFTQRLSDVQTAEQLGKISHQQYIRYLENESKRLHSIGNKTRQQIDQMNQIDLALKDATQQMEGQFNLGDIDTKGFVYAVRRATAEGRNFGASGIGSGGSVANNINTVTINGADTGTVRRLLQELLGAGAERRTAAPRRL